MMYTRYTVAKDLAAGKRVLELGCGAGQGLGLIGRAASALFGGDYSMALLRAGRRHYGARFPLARLSADLLPFRAGAFDLVVCFEATYYVRDMVRAFDEVARVLGPAGTALFVNANPERPDFIHSPHSVHYHAADEFRAALEARGFRVRVEGAFPVDPPDPRPSARVRALAFGTARRVLETFRLVPRTLRGRARLKRLVYGKLLEVPAELPEAFAPVAPRDPLERGLAPGFKVLYVTATRPGP